METKAKRASNNKWDAANMTVLGCKVRRDDADKYRAAAAAQHTTINAVIKQALNDLAESAESSKNTPEQN